MKQIITEGATPNGHPFQLIAFAEGSTVVSRCLQWLPFAGVGSISIPMRAECWFGQLYYELTRLGEASKETARNCFLT